MASENPVFSGLTDQQVKSILESIASYVDVACSVCLNEANCCEDHARAQIFYLLDHMLRGVGALADMASGSGVVGDLPTWLCGPNFHHDNEAAGAGARVNISGRA